MGGGGLCSRRRLSVRVVFTDLVPGHGAQESLAVLLCHDLVVVGEALFSGGVVIGADWLSVVSSHSLCMLC